MRPIAGAVLFLLGCSGRGPESAHRNGEAAGPPAVEDGPTARQRLLAAQEPAPPLPPGAASVRLDKAIDAFHQHNPSRRGYLAVDKPLYQPGESIWFRAFAVRGFGAEPGDAGGVTVQLVDPRGSVVQEKLVQADGGAASNDFILAPDAVGGEYVLKARAGTGVEVERRVIVSSYQPPRIKKKLEFLRKAYGPGDPVAAAVALHRGTGEPLAAQGVTAQVLLDGAEYKRLPLTTDPGGNLVVRFDLPAHMSRGDGLLTILVSDGGVTESIQKRIPILLDRMQLALYPEGGDLVTGLPGRVYLSARNSMDKPADVEGRVIDDRGDVVAVFRTVHDGLGRFEVVPQPGRSYRAEITRPTGIVGSYPLPAAHADGCSLQAIDDPGSARADVRVAVWCSQPRAVVATAMLRDQRLATAGAAVGDGPAVLSLPVPVGAQGAVRVTLFDGDLHPLAERLIYRNRRADLNVKLTADRASYQPRQGVTLSIETRTAAGDPVAADLAVAVVDDSVLSFADDKSAHLLARMYLEAEMPGQKIEEPDFYFSDDPAAAAGLDLVLGTFGWRRFDWKQVFAAPPEPPIEEGWEFTGERWKDRRAVHRRVANKPQEGKQGGADEEAEPEEKAVPARNGMVAQAPMRNPLAGQPAVRHKMEIDFDDEQVEGNMPAPAIDMAPGVAGEALDMAEVVLLRGGGRRQFQVGLEQDQHRIRIRDGKNNDNENDEWVNWAPAREFPLPSYDVSYDGPRVDFRDTIFWAPRVVTDAGGHAQVHFPLSDAVTSFRASAEGIGTGGQLGRGDTLVQSKLPVSLAVTLPLEVSSGDLVHLPVTVANDSQQPRTAALTAEFGPAFAIDAPGPASLELRPGERRTVYYDLRVIGDGADPAAGRVLLAAAAANLTDKVERTIRVAAKGFPMELSRAGTVSDHARHEVLISDVLPGTLDARVTMYPSPLATMVEGAEAMIAEPGGCFEQASSTNYPNIMILSYLEQQGAADADLVARTQGTLERGYKLLTGYESPQHGYEWFGGDPGHEALTAYGLLEFADMTRVFDDVDKTMVVRTASWLKSRRTGGGGYRRNERALDSFGSASPEVTDAYITWALAEAGEKEIDAELGQQARAAQATKDPYVMALATGALLDRERGSERTRAAVARLAGMQGDDGSFPGADHSITRSGGVALQLETTSLAALALMKAVGYQPQVRKAIEWINANRAGTGGFGSTQSTVLSLKALAAYAQASRRTKAPGTAIVKVNGVVAGRIEYEAGHQGAIEFDLRKVIGPGKNVIDIELDSKEPLPYSLLATWGSTVPAADPQAAVHLDTHLARTSVPMGETVRMDVKVTNATAKGIPMALARIGLPGGLTFQTWQLKELRDKKLIDFYETREREVILYFRSMAAHRVAEIPLELQARVPGTYTAPASRAYLYYTDEHKHWVAPSVVTVTP
ncbi:MAG TPA: MG2 domain-containing protein [Kofleriaceae bacterium]|nr:MG2 domain-containing protein [Kofleriaceae bacterium]